MGLRIQWWLMLDTEAPVQVTVLTVPRISRNSLAPNFHQWILTPHQSKKKQGAYQCPKPTIWNKDPTSYLVTMDGLDSWRPWFWILERIGVPHEKFAEQMKQMQILILLPSYMSVRPFNIWFSKMQRNVNLQPRISAHVTQLLRCKPLTWILVAVEAPCIETVSF